jgi:glucose-6-phosphate dehydrogenase assembly protein OpcA
MRTIPWPLWALTPPLFEHTVLTDIRWARLTRWRAALAHFFDLPAVRETSTTFSGLSNRRGGSRRVAALFAGWLDAAFGWRGRIVPEVTDAASARADRINETRGPVVPHRAVHPSDSTCLSTEGKVGSELGRLRVVSLGDQTLSTLLAEELRVRARDIAFERAVSAADSRRA